MKKNHLLFGFALIMLFAFMPFQFYGQAEQAKAKVEKKSTSFDRHWFLLGDAGLSMHHGDLAKYGFAPDPNYFKLNGNLGLGYQFNSIFGAYGKIGGGQLGGEKEWRNAKLAENSFLEGNLNLSINVINWLMGYNPDRMFTFEPHLGIGQAHWKAKAVNLTTGAPISEIGYVENGPEQGWMGTRASALTFPIGANFNFNVNEKLDLYADYTFNFMNSDRLDAFQDTDLGQYRQGTVLNDMYSHFNIGLKYKLISNSVKSMVDNFGLVTLTATPDPLVEKGDMVDVTITGTFPPKYFKKNAAMNFTPVLTYDGGSVALRPINFKGEKVTGDGTVINYAKGGTFTYTDRVPYHPNMKVSQLDVTPLIYPAKALTNTTADAVKQNEKYLSAAQRKLADGVIFTSKRIGDKLKPIYTEHGYEKVTIISQNATMYFQVNLHDWNKSLPLNKKTENIEKLKALSKNLEMGWQLKDITIAGWASPEGEETFNSGLSDRRSTTAKKYVDTEFAKLLKNKKLNLPFKKVTELNYNRSGNGPDWNGFMVAVEASNIKDKNAILNVVRSSDVAKREQEIRNMILIYPELEKEILPALRRAMISVNTFEPKKTDQDIATLSTTDPSKLSLNELLYAATLTDDLKTKQLVYANAMKLHPTCMRAVLNAAEIEIQLANIAEAKSLLEKGKKMSDKSALLYQKLGTVSIMERNFILAEENLNKAQQLGGNVDYSMGLVNIFKGDYSKAISLMKNEKCDYNLGLAQLLNKDYSAAKATLDCAPETAQSLYLKAVIAARTNEKAAVYSNLMKSIKLNDKMKACAKGDREFVKLFNEVDFQNIVK